MKTYAQFFTTDLEGYVHEVVGPRGIMQLDGRLSRRSQHNIAAHECKRRNFDSYCLAKGESRLNLTHITPHFTIGDWSTTDDQ